nr:PREDICTED: zonadhesin-like [Struthio camelus australis]
MTQSLDSCLPCPPGHYCGKENLTGVSGKCDAGWFCVSAAWTSQPFDLDNYTNANCLCPATATGGKCLAGFYCPKGSPEPLPCPPGFYCNASGLSVPSGQCTAGFYCKGGAALPQPTDGATGNICPVGTYCTAASAAPRLCPAGTFSSLPGRRMLSECQPCPSGFYCKVPGLSVPTGECWEGYYCDSQQGPVIDFTLYPCPQGFYCPPGTRQSTQYSCPAGTFGPRQKLTTVKQCQRCPPGKYCEFSGLAAPTGACAEGFWCKSGARVRNPRDGESGLPCPPGHYCPEGAPLPLQCPPGTWSDSEGGRNLQECQPCPGGYYCNSSGLRAPSGHCSPGYYCVSGAQTPAPTDGLSGAPCPIRHFCPLGSRSPAPCPPGSYMPQTHGEECHACAEGEYCVPGEKPQPCPQGFYCPGGTGLDWQPCPPGTYSPEQGQGSRTSCRACDGGKFCQYHNATAVTGECWEGYYCTQGSYKPNPDAVIQGRAGPCPAGHYCPRGTSVPTPCPVGTFSSRSRMSSETQCSPCLPGHYCDAAGLPAPTGQCAEGFYCTLGSTLPNFPVVDKAGGPCPRGYFCPKGTAVPMACPAGSYNPSQRQASCLPCAKGFFCPENSSSFLENECSTGHYCPAGTASPTQFPCPKGTYNPQTRSSLMSHCTPCDPGHYCAFAGQSRVTGPCLAGFYCSRGVSSPAPTDGLLGNKCPKGTYCPMGSAFPQPCPLGYYSNSTGNTRIEDCLLCDAGHFCNGTGLSSPSGLCEAGFYCSGGALSPKPPRTTVSGGPCPPGHYCAVGSSRAQPCPAGSYSPSWSMAQCLECPEGFYCKTASTDYTDCPAGHYCPKSTEFATQYPCPPGTYCEALNIWDVSKCQLCPPGRVCSKPGLARPDGLCMPGWFCARKDQPEALQEDFSHGVVKPVICPAGHYCLSGTKAANQYPCPEGTFSNQTGLRNPRECRPCPGGTFCATAGLLTPSGPCLPGYYCTLKARLPNPVNDETGDLCPAGHFCPPGSSKPELCPAGTFLPQSGMVFRNACLPCPGGKFCQGEGLASVSGTCYAGYFCDVGSTEPNRKHCPPGSYCPEGSESPVPCSPGSFNSDSGKWQSTDCQLCPAGYFCSGSGAHTPELCPAGYFCLPGTNFSTEHPCPRGTFGTRAGATSESDCEPCPAGTYCSAPGLSQPSGFCRSGYHCTKGAISPAPFKHRVESAVFGLPGNNICPVGHFCPAGTGYPIPCPPGSFSASLGLEAEEQCQPCPAGRYCSGAGLSNLAQTSLCNAGYVCLEGNSSPSPSDRIHGYRCPSGFYCPAGTGLELPCEPGTFSPVPGANVCLPCPAGMTCSNAATVKPLHCPRGYYCPIRTAAPLPCPEGTLNPVEGSLSPAACKLCPVGRYCRGDANWEPDGLCPAGYYCGGGATDAIPHRTPGFPLSGPCPLGHYCPEGTHVPVACPVGTLNNATGGTSPESCVPCYPGSFCASAGLSSPTGPCTEGFYCPADFSSFSPTAFLCPKGHFCPLGAAHPMPCPAGEYQPTRGSASCVPCRRGSYCQEAVAGDPKRCPPHAYCPTGTQVPHPCPEGTFTLSNMTGLWNEKECLACLPGHYCRHGRLEGKCAAGYFCLAGSSQSTPQGHSFPWSFLSECRWGQVCAGLCPAGFYCQEGSEVPVPCPANTIRNIPGAKQREDCLPCPPGHWCKAGDSEAYPCPSGHYCFGGNDTDHGSLLAPQKCPPHTYHKYPGARSLADCQPCPPGYLCPLSGLTSFEDHPCPLGHWCPGRGDVFLCPPGTSRIQPGATSLEECDSCSPGYYCPDPAQTGLPNTQGVPCKPGYECPPGSVNPIPCRPGSYCGARTAVPSLCPGGYYCPEGSSTYRSPEQLCVFPYYCPPGSARPLLCEGGYMALSLPGPRDSFEKFCRICDAGTYRSDSLITAACQPCPAGFICPQGSKSYHQQPCPRGYYCPPLVPAPLPCPPGTHGSSNFAKRIEECQACPAGSFNHLPAQPACFPCGSSSSSRPGAASCTCHGLNRAFQQSDASCICQAGYVYYDERGKKNPDSNSDQDCQPQVDELCAPGEVRLASTRQCVFPEQYDCSTSCGPAGGEINAELGICHCKHYVSAEELCDQACLLRAPQISLRFGINRELLLRMDEGEEREVTNVLGPDEHVHESQQVRLVLFSPSGVLGFIVSSTDVLDAFLTGDLASDTFLQKGHRGRKASSRGIAALPLVPNPIVCLETGDAVLFQLSINPHNRASSHYPVYQKLHLYNSNPGWDFGPFRRLDHLVRETHLNISWFAHVFLDSGTYVFRDRTIQEHFLIVTVNEAHVGCDPRGVSFQPSSPFQLARHGVLKHQELNLAPNWAAIAVVLLVLGFLIVAFTTLAIVLQSPDPTLSPLKSWKPRWRSLGEPHVPPEYVLVKDSLQFCPVLGPRGSGEGAGLGEKGAARNAEEHFALRDLEDFSVRTMYDKLEDQNLHLASQLAKHRMDVLVFYKGVSQQLRGLMDMVQALDSEGLNNFARQRVCGHRTSDSLGAEKRDDSSNNFQAVMHTGAQWQEATELMKALKFLLGRAQPKNATVKREMEEQVPGQDVVAGSTRTSEGKAEVMDGQDPDLPPQCELCSRKPTFFSFPGHEETEKCLSDSSSENTGSTLVPTDLASLSPYQFIVYRFGCAVLRLLIRTYSCPALVLKLARSVPARSPDQDVLPVLRDSHYDAINRYLYIRATRLEDAGEFIAILLSAVAWIKAGSASRGIVHSFFLTELNGAVVVLANASFQHLWEAAEKDPSGGSLSAHFDPQTMLEELLSIRVSPYPYVKEKALGERLQQYRCLQLPLESENRMENSQKREDSRSVGSSDFKLKAAKLEETLDELNEEFFELTVQALRSQEEGELLEQVLRTQEESTVTASIDHVYEAQCFPELLDSWATKRDEALLLEIQRSCIAQRIEEAEAELFYLLQNKIAASSLH